MDEIRRMIKDRCMEKEEPFCASVCPFHLDVREFIARMRRGAFNTAFRLFSNTTGFPAIVAALCPEPCAAVCPRGTVDAPVQLNILEKAAVAYAANTQPNSYNLPPKKGRIAVVGAGLSGLGCALRLANRKYHVDVYERSARVGGRLWDEMDPEIFLADIRLQFSNEEYGLFLDHAVETLEPLRARYDAIYVATGSGGDAFGLTCENDGREGIPWASRLPGVFLGGALFGANSMEALSQGLKASLCIEDYLKTGAMRSAERVPPTRMRQAPEAIASTPVVLPADDALSMKEEAVAEAARCIRCRCDACVRHCGLMRYFKKFPGRIAEEVEITITPGTLDGNGTVATRLIASCNQCGLCAEVCPERIDMGEFLRASHQAMREKGAMPQAFHDFWLRDMEFANSERASLSAPPPGGTTCTRIFFPGCQLGASDPRYVKESYRFLLGLEPGVALRLGCCGAPAVWAGDMELFRRVRERILDDWRALGSPQMVMACPTCLEMFARYIPEIDCAPLVDILAASGHPPAEQGNGEIVSVFDPCASRNRPESQRAARSLVRGAGYELAPLPYEGKRAQCCSYGGQIDIAAPKYARWLADQRSKDGEAPYVVYCSNCRDVFAHAGKPVRHVLDVFFGLNGWNAAPPTFDERRKRREDMKTDLIQEFWPDMELRGREESMENRKTILIAPELREKMNRERLLEEDALDVIEECERSGRRIWDPSAERYFGCKEIGFMTQWVEYAPSPEGYALFNTYAHRMKIEREDAPHGRN